MPNQYTSNNNRSSSPTSRPNKNQSGTQRPGVANSQPGSQNRPGSTRPTNDNR